MNSTMSERSRHVWSHPETLALIDAWEERYDVLRSQRRTAHVHEDIRQALSDLQIEKSIRQIVVKIDNLTQKYRKTRLSGKANPTWIYYKRLDKFMGFQRRYGRRRAVARTEPYSEDDGSDAIPCEQSSSPPISMAVSRIQSSEWSSYDFPTLVEQTSGGNYREDLMNIITHQLEVQRQSLVVQEKVISLLKDIVSGSSEIPVPKLEME